jgi:hypothetical protein
MEKHKFTVTEWVFSESTCAFLINFSVASLENEDCEFYTLTVPYNFEEPGQFQQKVHSMMSLYVNNVRNLNTTKTLLADFTFVELAKASNKINSKQENMNESEAS